LLGETEGNRVDQEGDQENAPRNEITRSIQEKPEWWLDKKGENIIVSLGATALSPVAHAHFTGESVLEPVARILGTTTAQTILGNIVQRIINKMRSKQNQDPTPTPDLTDALREALEEALNRHGTRAELSKLLHRIHAVETALEAAPDKVRAELAIELRKASTSRDEYRWIDTHTIKILQQLDQNQQETLRISRETWVHARQAAIASKALLSHTISAEIGKRFLPPVLPEDTDPQDTDPEDSDTATKDAPEKSEEEHQTSSKKGACPYMGLRAFGQEDAWAFCGRDKLIDQLAARLEESHFIGIIGPSGSGKTSLTQAGLLPRLQQTDSLGTTGRWRGGQVFRPGKYPLEALAFVVCQDTGLLPGMQADDLRRGSRNLDLTAQLLLLEAPRNARYLLIVDQFEEIFTLCEDEKERERFIDLLIQAAISTESRTSLLITLRSDFYGHCASYPNLARLLEKDQFLVPPLGTAETRQAIVQPALSVGLIPEPGLEECVLRDLHEAPGGLPLLSQALRTTWEHREDNLLTIKGYEAGGGIAHAITQTAEKIWKSFSPEEQETTRKLFLRLTRLGDGTEDTRRRIKRTDLQFPTHNQNTVDKVLSQLTNARLLTLDGTNNGTNNTTTLEVAHEALIHKWQRLRNWLEENREGHRTHHNLTVAATTWYTTDRNSADLYRGTRLEIARIWASAHIEDLNKIENDFLTASHRQEENNKTRQRIFRTILAIALLLIALYGIKEANAAEEKKARAIKEKLETEAQRHLENPTLDTRIGALLTVESDKRSHDIPVSLDSLTNTLLQNVLTGHNGRVSHATFSSDGTLLATSSEDGTARIWNPHTGKLQHTLTGHKDKVTHTAFNRGSTLLATSSEDGTARIWNPHTGTLKYTLEAQTDKKDTNQENTDKVPQTAFNYHGTLLATTSTDGTARIWDPKTGTLQHTLTGHTGKVIHAAFSPKGRLLATTSEDHTVRIWNPETGTLQHILEGHDKKVKHTTFNHDGELLATTSNDRTTRIWDPHTGTLKHTLTGHTDDVVNAAFNPDGTLLATASEDGTTRIWNPHTGTLEHTLTGHTGKVTHTTFSPDGELLATTSNDRTTHIWNPETGTLQHTLTGHTGKVTHAAFNYDGTLLATTSTDGTTRIWKPRTGTPQHTLKGHEDWVSYTTFNHDSTMLATISGDGTARIWNPHTGTPQHTLKGHEDWVSYTTFNHDSTLLATTSGDGTARIWNPETGTLQHTLKHEKWVSHAAFNPNGTMLATTSTDGTARIWNPETGTLQHTLEGHTGWVSRAAFSPNGTLLATTSKDRTARIWNPETGTLQHTLKHEKWVSHAAFNHDGTMLATTSGDRTARIWNPHTGKLQHTLKGHSGEVIHATFSPDSALLATTSGDSTVRIWNPHTGALKHTLIDHNDRVSHATFNHDGTLLATTSDDRTARIWNPRNGTLKHTLTGHNGWVSHATFNHDGTLLATTSDDRTARIWNMTFPSRIFLQKKACKIAGRNLTRAEWKKFLPGESYQGTCPQWPDHK